MLRAEEVFRSDPVGAILIKHGRVANTVENAALIKHVTILIKPLLSTPFLRFLHDWPPLTTPRQDSGRTLYEIPCRKGLLSTVPNTSSSRCQTNHKQSNPILFISYTMQITLIG
jgi:hypothetical protein